MVSYLRNCVVFLIVVSTLVCGRQFPSLTQDVSSLLGQSRLQSGYYEPEPSPEGAVSCDEARKECEEQCQGARFSFHCSDLTGLRTKCYCLSTLASISGADANAGDSTRCKLAESQCDRDCDGFSEFQCQDDGLKFSQSCACVSGFNYLFIHPNDTTQKVQEMNSPDVASEIASSPIAVSSQVDVPTLLDQDDYKKLDTPSPENNNNSSKQDVNVIEQSQTVIEQSQTVISGEQVVDKSEQVQPFLRSLVVTTSAGKGQNTSSNTMVYKYGNQVSVSHSVSATSTSYEIPSYDQLEAQQAQVESIASNVLEDKVLSEEEHISLDNVAEINEPQPEVEQEDSQKVIENPSNTAEAETIAQDSSIVKVIDSNNVSTTPEQPSNQQNKPKGKQEEMKEKEEVEDDDSNMHPRCLEAKQKCQKKCGEFKKPKFHCEMVGNSFSQGCSCSSDSSNSSVKVATESQ